MAKIRLFQRTEVGPTRAGAAKPGFDLARGAGLAEIGAATSKFAGAIFEDLVATLAANEEATHQGVVRSEMAGFDTFVAANPAASFEELEKERDKMFGRIDAAGKKATTRKAQRNIKNFMARNKEFMFKTTQESMETIRSKQELLASEAHVKNFMNNFQREELREHYEDMLEAEVSIYRRDVIFGPVGKDGVRVGGLYEEQVAIIDKAEKKVAIANAVKIGFGAWEATVSKENPVGSLDDANEVIDALDLPEDEKQEIISKLKIRVTNQRAENQIQLEVARERSRDDINKAIFESNDYGAADALIAGSELDEPEQRSWFQLSIQRATAAAKGVPIENDRVIESEMYDMSLGIWKGNVTKADFDAELLKVSRNLDDDAYKRVTASASNTLKASQAQALTTAATNAKNVLVSFKSEDALNVFIAESIEGLEPDVAKIFRDNTIIERQLQFNNVAAYNGEMRQWITDNPTKTGKDFHIEAERLKHIYWARNIEDLEDLRETQAAAVDETFDPKGSGFDLQTSRGSGAVPDSTGHLGSLDPRTGMLLKGLTHPTIHLTFQEEGRLGNKIVKKGDRFFSVPKDAQGKAITLPERAIDAEMAKQILIEAGGDRDKARQIARDRGFKF